MGIDAVLRLHQWREGHVPTFGSQNIPSDVNRLARRRFDPAKPNGLVLPWIAMNPSGKVENGTGPTGKRIFIWSWRWHFDECVVYNVQPFKESKSKIAHKSFFGRDNEILDSHQYVAKQLRDSNAVIVAWGDGPRASIDWAQRLMAAINDGREKPIATWCLSTNKSGQPRHPSPLAKVPLTKQPEEWISVFA